MTEPLEPRPITRSLRDENKIGSLWGFVGIDKRQVWVMMALLFGCFLIWSVLELFFNLNAVQVAAIFVPLSVIVMAFSLLKLQGRYMDFWLRRGIDRALKPQRLKWRRKPPGKPGYLRDSVQSLMPQDQLYWQMLRTVDGQYVMVFELELVTLSLTSDAQRAAVERASQQLYNRAAGYDWQEMMIGTGRDTKLLARRLQHKAEKTIRPGQTKRLELAKQRARFYAEIGAEHGAQDRRAYLILPWRPPKPVKGASQVPVVTKTHARMLQAEARNAYGQLRVIAGIFRDGYRNMGVELNPLMGGRLQKLLQEQAAGTYKAEQLVQVTPGNVRFLPAAKGAARNAAKEDPAGASDSPIVTDQGPYANLADPSAQGLGGPIPGESKSESKKRQRKREKLNKVLGAANEQRGDEPPAFAIGDLTLPDRLSPDALDIRDDAIRVGDTWRQGSFVADMPDEIPFGALIPLSNWQSPIKITKHIRSVPYLTARQIVGGKIASLTASEETDTRRDAIEDESREMNTTSARYALKRLMRRQEHLFKLSLHAEVSDESLRNVRDLTRQLEAELSAAQMTTLTARQEAWRSFITNQPLALDMMDKNYAEHGLMTDALATLWSFGGQQINHKNGILFGLDRESGNLVVLDNEKLTNPHILFLGVTGSGKTFSLKLYTTTACLMGYRVIIIDPVGDSKYDRVADAMDGQYVELQPGTKDKINPFDLRAGGGDYLNLSFFSGDIDDLGKESELRKRAKIAALPYKKQVLVALVSTMATGSSGEKLTVKQRNRAERLIGQVYAAAGITEDPDTHDEVPPTFVNFFEMLHEQAASDPELADLKDKLYQWDPLEGGSLSEYFDSQTNVDLSSDYLVCKVSGLPPAAKRPIQFALMDFMVPILSNPKEPAILDMEELWDVLTDDPDDPVARYTEEFSRSGRARRCVLAAASQHPSEFLKSRIGEVILDQAETKVLLQMGGRALETIKELWNLSPEEAKLIENANPGEGTLRIGSKISIPIKGLASEFEQELFNTDPNLETRYEEARQAEAAAEAQASEAKATGDGPDGTSPVPAETAADHENGQLSDSARLRRILEAQPSEEQPHSSSNLVEDANEPVAEARDAEDPDSDAEIPVRPDGSPEDGIGSTAGTVSSNGSGPDGSARPGAGPRESEVEEPGVAPEPEPEPHTPEPGQPQRLQPAGSGLPDEPAPPITVPARDEALIWAFTGHEAGRAAYHAAGLLAAENPERRIILVDAEGHISQEILSTAVVSPDDYIFGGLQGPVDRYLATHPLVGLSVLFCADPHAPGRGLVRHLRGHYDVVIVPCADTPYGREWLIGADRVVAAATRTEDLDEALTQAERLRGTNGTILAPMTDAAGASLPEEFPGGLTSHPIFSLPEPHDAAFTRAEEEQDFASVSEPYVGDAFRPLLGTLLADAAAPQQGLQPTTASTNEGGS